MRSSIYAENISKTIVKLHKEYPGLPIGEHIAHALDGGDIYNISDRELAEALMVYLASLELDEAFHSDDTPNDYDSD